MAKKEFQKVKNQYGVIIDFEAAVISMMDDDLREKVHNLIAPCTEQEFFDTYALAHRAMFDVRWELDTPNPTW